MSNLSYDRILSLGGTHIRSYQIFPCLHLRAEDAASPSCATDSGLRHCFLSSWKGEGGGGPGGAGVGTGDGE